MARDVAGLRNLSQLSETSLSSLQFIKIGSGVKQATGPGLAPLQFFRRTDT